MSWRERNRGSETRIFGGTVCIGGGCWEGDVCETGDQLDGAK